MKFSVIFFLFIVLTIVNSLPDKTFADITDEFKSAPSIIEDNIKGTKVVDKAKDFGSSALKDVNKAIDNLKTLHFQITLLIKRKLDESNTVHDNRV